jgi:hypothetical protein
MPPASAGVTSYGWSQQTATCRSAPGGQSVESEVPSLGRWNEDEEAEQIKRGSRAIPALPAEVGSLLLSAVRGRGVTANGNAVAALCARLYPRANVLELAATVQHLFQEASERFSTAAERSEALEWAQGYALPADIFVRDEVLLQESNGDLRAMLDTLQGTRRRDRFSRERVCKMVPEDDPGYKFLLPLADGMDVVIPEGFKFRSEPMPLRQLYKELHPAINKLLAKQWESEKAIILRTSVARSIPGIHYSPVHWCTSKDKQEGRQLYDFSDDTGGSAINCDEVREWGRVNIGLIHNPTLSELINMIMRFFDAEVAKDPSFTWDDMVLCKMDLKSAFNLLNFNPDHVKYLAAALTDDLTIMQHVGCFGYTNLPYYFDHIPKVIVRLLRGVIRGVLDMYVDDVMMATLRRALEADQEKVREVCTGLLGPTAVAADKTFSGRTLDWIGWQVDTVSQTVCLSEHCFLKTVYLFYDIDTEASATVLQIQQLGSLAVRYSEICVVMRPYTLAIWAPIVGRKPSAAKVTLTQSAKRAIWMWRVTLALLRWDRLSLSRTFQSFVKEPRASYLLVSDASLSGFGGQVFDLRSGEPVLVGVLREQFPSEYNLDESSFQNLAEFVGILALVLMLVVRGVTGVSFVVRGDSKTALKWVSSQKYGRADRNNNASLLFTLLMTKFKLQVHSTEFLRSKENHLCDALSRGVDMASYGPTYSSVSSYYVIGKDSAEGRLLRMCNPRATDDGSVGYFIGAWLYISSIFEEIGALDFSGGHPIRSTPSDPHTTNVVM